MSISIYKENSISIMDFSNKCSPFRKTRVEKVKKTLFGPIDYEETENFINTHLKRAEESACKKWNFDFPNERILDGNWSWRLPSPLKINRKRKIENGGVDSSNSLYFQPIDPADQNSTSSSIICKPQPSGKPNKIQSKITDFMQQSKMTVIYKKETSNERPKKIQKLLGDCSS